jgi:hypothetical protein
MLLSRHTPFFSLALVCCCALAQAHAAPRPLFTGVGPDDVMRALPRSSDTQAALLRHSAMRRPLAKEWAQQLLGVVAVLQALDEGQVPHARPDVEAPCAAAHWKVGTTSECTPLATSRHLLGVALAGARDFEKLRFPGVDGAYPAPTTHAVLQGASFIGAQGSRVLLVNLGTAPIRIDLGDWVVAKPALHQAWLRPLAAPGKPRLERLVHTTTQQPIVLPPESISVVG